jgi:hypothetical protein
VGLPPAAPTLRYACPDGDGAGMQDTYTPEAGTAQCPRCGLVVPGAPVLSGVLTAAGLFWYCVRCRLPWSEL